MRIPGTKFEISFRNLSQIQPKEDRIRDKIKMQQQLQRITQDILKWRTGLKAAESIYSPNRRMLLQTYKDIVIDSHLSGLMSSRKNKLLSKRFQVLNSEGEVDDALTALFDAQWFRDFLDLSLDSKAYGHSLIQLGSIIDDKFESAELVPREYTKPEFGIVTQQMQSNYGTSYEEKPYSDWCISVGGKRDLGYLSQAAPLVIWKKNTFGSWAEYVEIFGSPLRVGRTDVRDVESFNNMTAMLKNIGSAGWAVLNETDKIEFLAQGKSDTYKVYDQLIERTNSELSKLVLGQTMTTDDGSSRSQAQVHEEVCDEYADADENFILRVIYDKLFPLMIGHGFKLTPQTKCKFSEVEKVEPEQKILIDKELMTAFDLDPEYIEKTYGTPVIKKEVVQTKPFQNPGKVAALLKEYYK